MRMESGRARVESVRVRSNSHSRISVLIASDGRQNCSGPFDFGFTLGLLGAGPTNLNCVSRRPVSVPILDDSLKKTSAKNNRLPTGTATTHFALAIPRLRLEFFVGTQVTKSRIEALDYSLGRHVALFLGMPSKQRRSRLVARCRCQ